MLDHGIIIRKGTSEVCYQDVQLMLVLVPKVVKGLWGTMSR